MQGINWEMYRDEGGKIKLLEVYADLYGTPPPIVEDFFSTINTLRPMNSRQLSAVVIALARSLANGN